MNARDSNAWITALLAVSIVAFGAASAPAATVSLSRFSRPVTSEEVAGGAPLGAFVHDFFLSADTDLLSIGNVVVDAPLFQHLLGGDSSAPDLVLASASPGLSADSFLTTPGSTIMVGGGLSQSSGDALWGDLTDDGATSNFHFARLTTHQMGHFSGQVAVAGYDQPVYLPFNFLLPGTEAELGLLTGESPLWMDYSLDPPPAPPEPVLPTPPVFTPPPSGPPDLSPPAVVPPDAGPPESPALPVDPTMPTDPPRPGDGETPDSDPIGTPEIKIYPIATLPPEALIYGWPDFHIMRWDLTVDLAISPVIAVDGTPAELDANNSQPIGELGLQRWFANYQLVNVMSDGGGGFLMMRSGLAADSDAAEPVAEGALIPEPAGAVLLALGATAGVGIRARHRRR